MPALTKKRPTKSKSKGKDRVTRVTKKSRSAMVKLSDGRNTYAIPKHIAKEYIIKDEKESVVSSDDVFKNLNEKYTKAGALLKGVRAREGMNQTDFADKIDVTQANLSKMENGKRPIGRTVAKRIAKVFDVDYRHFLE